jgi:putative spermidine/putrescine transport system permease protein
LSKLTDSGTLAPAPAAEAQESPPDLKTRRPWFKHRTAYVLAAPSLFLLLTLFLGSMLTLLEYSFRKVNFGGPDVVATIATWTEFLGSGFRWEVVGETVTVGLLSTVIAAAVGIPLAYGLHKIRSKAWRYAGMFIVFAPLMTSVIARTYGWSLLLGDQGLLNSALSAVGLPTLELLYALPSVIIAMVHIVLPFIVFPIMSSLGQLDGALTEAARDLGASRFRTFRRVTLPLILPGIIAGAQIVFALSISAFATPSLLGGGRVAVLATSVYSDVNNVQWPMAAVSSFVLVILAVIVLGLFNIAQRKVRVGGQMGVTGTTDEKGIRKPMMAWLAFVYFFVLSPLVIIVINSFSTSTFGAFPPPGWTLDWYTNLASQEGLAQAVYASLFIAGWTMAIVIVIGTCAAIAFHRYPSRMLNWFSTFSLSPMLVPKVALGLGAFLLLHTFHVFEGVVGIILMHVVITLPFVIIVLTAAMSRTDPTLDEAARDLGAKPIKAFYASTFFAIRPALIASALFSFIISFDEVDMTVFMLSPGQQTLPIWMFVYMQKYQDPTLAALATILILFSLVIAAIAALFLLKGVGAPNEAKRDIR